MRWRSVFGFDDSALDARYEAARVDSTLPQLRIALILAGFGALIFVPLDGLYFSGDILNETIAFRVLVMFPTSMVLYAATFREKFLPCLPWCCSVAIIAFTTYFCWLAWRLDVSVMPYLFPAIIHLALFLFILIPLPFRVTLATGVPCLLICLVSFVFVDGDWPHRVSFASGIFSIFLFLIFNQFQRDMRERTLFVSNERLEELEQEKEVWFRNFAGFLRHELNNQMAGVQSSLELLQRNPEKRADFILRANESLESMQAMVNEAADATSIDEALSRGEFEHCDVTELVYSCVMRYQLADPDVEFRLETEPAPAVAQPFRIVQLADKLLTNAVEHHSPGTPIVVTVQQQHDKIRLTVENEGHALPANHEQMFALWFSAHAGQGGHAGLGLYVVARIAKAHGGRAWAEDLADVQGARLVVELACNPTAPE